MQHSKFIIAALLVASCSDRYNDDQKGAYGNGPMLQSCDDLAACQQHATAAAQDIRAGDTNFEQKYLDGMKLEDALQELTMNGFVKQRRVRILKAFTAGDVMRVYLSVQDKVGQPTTDIAALGLTLMKGEKTIEFSSKGTVAAGDLAFSTVMDYSGSMGAALPKLEAATVQLYRTLSEAQFAVVKFSNEAKLVAPMARRSLDAGFETTVTGSFPSGTTALFDGMLEGIKAHRGESAEKALDANTLPLGLVFTDGVENSSRAKYEEVKSELRNAKIPQIILGMGDVDIKSLLTLAEDTNGLFQFIPNGSGIETAMVRVAQIAKSIVQIEIPLGPASGNEGLVPEDLIATFKEK